MFAQGTDYPENVKAQNQATKATRQAEKNIAKEVKNNPKHLWSYTNTKMETRMGIADLTETGKGDDMTV